MFFVSDNNFSATGFKRYNFHQRLLLKNQKANGIYILQTGRNEQSQRKILDMTRLISIVLRMLYCYITAMLGDVWSLLATWETDSKHIGNTGLFANFNKSKLMRKPVKYTDIWRYFIAVCNRLG
jgi:hypothetical protein